MKRLTIRRLGLLLLGSSLALAPLIAEAGARAPRGGGSGGGGGAKVTRTATRAPAAAPRATASSGARATAPRATAPRGGKQTASGRATYGYYNGGYYYPGYPGYWPGYYPGYGYPWYWDPWYWDYWPGWSVGITFGWPYFSYGAYYAPYPYAYPPEPPPVEIGPAAIEIDVKPSSARVVWNGEDVGRAKDYNGSWDRLRVPAGRQWLELKAEGYKTLRVAVDARSGGAYRLDYALEKGEGMDPRSQDPAALPPPQAQAAAAPELGMEPGPPSARLEKGFLRLAVTPADAAVYLDGEYFARADELARLRGAIPLAVGEHRVDVVRPGYGGRSVTVTVDRGATATATVDLTKAE